MYWHQCHGLELSRIEITITLVTFLLANQHLASESEMCADVHMISVKVMLWPREHSEFFDSLPLHYFWSASCGHCWPGRIMCGIFYFRWHKCQIKRTNGFECIIGKMLAKWGKGNCQSFQTASVGFEAATTRLSVARSNRWATAPPQILSHIAKHVIVLIAVDSIVVSAAAAFWLVENLRPLLCPDILRLFTDPNGKIDTLTSQTVTLAASQWADVLRHQITMRKFNKLKQGLHNSTVMLASI